MLRKRRLQAPVFQPPTSSSQFPALWINGIGSLIAVAVGVVTAKSAGLAPVWMTILLTLGVLLILGLALPSLFGLFRQWRARQRLARGLRVVWASFRHEVDERRWLYTSQHAHSLSTLLTALRSAPQDHGGQFRVQALRSAVPTCAALDGMRLHVDAMVDAPWSGVDAACAIIGMFEVLIAFPDHSGWMRELTALAEDGTDGKLVTEWLDRYRSSLEQYARWSRDRNRELGEDVFRKYFL